MSNLVDKNTYFAISDPEGYSINDMIPKNTKYDKLIVVGDILDSTFASAFNDKTLDYLKLKSNNLSNIKEVIKENSKVKLVFGNRDLNKIKCKYLLEIDESLCQDCSELNNFNGGNLKLPTEQDHESFMTKYISTKNITNIWKIKDMNAWYTFWNPAVGDKGKKEWVPSDETRKNIDHIYKHYPFLMRFLEVFGVDNAPDNGGTMSAQNLLLTIPIEIGLTGYDSDEYLKAATAFINHFLVHYIQNAALYNTLTSDELFIKSAYGAQDKHKEKQSAYDIIQAYKYNDQMEKRIFVHMIKMLDILDHAAFAVCAVFRSMTLPITNSLPNPIELKIENTNQVKSWLTQLFQKGEACMYLNTPTKDIIFSHGGITESLMKNPETINTIKNNIKSTTLKDYLTNATKFYSLLKQQKGGYFSEDFKFIDIYSMNINNNIKTINDSFKESIKLAEAIPIPEQKSFMPNPDMLFLLMMTTNFDCISYLAKTTITDDEKIKLCDGILSMKDISPIAPGIIQMRQQFFMKNNRTIYQIIGHAPSGYGATIDCFEKDKKKGYLINLDASNSFLGTPVNKLSDKKLQSYTYADISNDKVTIKTKIDLKDNKYTFDIKELKTLDGNIYQSGYNYNIKSLIIDNEIDTEIYKYVKLTKGNNKFTDTKAYESSLCYHGFTKKNNQPEYHILTHIISSPAQVFNKTLLILSPEDFTKFFTASVQSGGSSESIHYYKYLKYKKKYLSLSKQKL